MPKHKILIVDDEENVRFILERALRQDGYEIQFAQDGGEAIKKINAEQYDLLLLDLHMPPVNGIDVLHHLRKSGQDAVVILLTAHSTIESAIEALRLSAFDYLLKPAPIDVIRSRVREGLHFRQQKLYRQRLLDEMEHLRQTLAELDSQEAQQQSAASPDRFLRSGSLVIDLHHRITTLGDALLDLTTTEYNLLVTLVSAAPQSVSPSRLVKEALGYESSEAEARELIKWHIYHLRKKIESNPEKPKYIKTVRYQGYLWSGVA